LKEGMNRVGDVEVIVDYDDERNLIIDTDGD
jgi:hypothetical protein